MRAATCSTRSGSGRLAKAREAERWVQLALRLEGQRAGENAPVEFRHRDMHGEVGRRQPTLALLPSLAPRGGDDNLHDRNPGAVEQCFGAGLRARREGGRGDDQRRLQFAEGVFHENGGGGILQAGDEDRDWVHAFCGKRLRQRVDWRDIGCQQHRAIEEDGDDGWRRQCLILDHPHPCPASPSDPPRKGEG